MVLPAADVLYSLSAKAQSMKRSIKRCIVEMRLSCSADRTLTDVSSRHQICYPQSAQATLPHQNNLDIFRYRALVVVMNFVETWKASQLELSLSHAN